MPRTPDLAAAVLALGALAAGAAPAQDGAARPDESLDVDQVIAWAAPTADDLRHREVAWHATVLDGVLAAQAADRPLLVWLYFGGPLGDC